MNFRITKNWNITEQTQELLQMAEYFKEQKPQFLCFKAIIYFLDSRWATIKWKVFMWILTSSKKILLIFMFYRNVIKMETQ